MRSLEARLADVERLAERETAAEVPVQVDLVCCDSREEALALMALPPTPPPASPGIVRLVPVHHTASDYLNQLGGPRLPEHQD